MICSKCSVEKSEEEFYKKGSGRQSYCKQCAKDVRNIWNKENPEKAKIQRKAARVRRYGIDLVQYAELFDLQNGQCAICNRVFQNIGGKSENAKEAAYIDHDHATGRVRGLLCNWCNAGLGNFYDNKDYLRSAIDYLS